MKAAVCYAFDQPLTIEEIDIDPPQQGEVKIRLAATAAGSRLWPVMKLRGSSTRWART